MAPGQLAAAGREEGEQQSLCCSVQRFLHLCEHLSGLADLRPHGNFLSDTSSLARRERSLDKLCGARVPSPYICKMLGSMLQLVTISTEERTYALKSRVKPDAKLLLLNIKSPIFVAVRRIVLNVPTIEAYSFRRCLQEPQNVTTS